MKKTKALFILICFLISVNQIFAQQTPQYTQWSSHQFALNPAHAGIKPCLDVHSLYRAQWVGFEGAPKSGFLTFSAPIKTPRRKYLSARQGIGFRFESDQIGQFTTSRFNIAYAAHFNFSADTRLSLGLFGGMIQTGYDPSKSVTLQPDPSISKDASFLSPDATFGAWWNGKNYYVGLVMQNLIPSKWELGLDSKYRFHTLINGGYRIRMNEKTTLLPAVLLKIPPRGPVAADLQIMLDYGNKLNFGVGYRNTDALLFFAGFKINQRFAVQYSYDVTLSALRVGSNNSHEIAVSFSTCKPLNTSTSSCPLFE